MPGRRAHRDHHPHRRLSGRGHGDSRGQHARTARPRTPVITEDGREVQRIESKIVPLGNTTPTGVVLVIDASNSMAGQKLEEAKDAALAFVEQKRPEDQVAVIAFGRDSQGLAVQRPTRKNSGLSSSRSKLLGNQTPALRRGIRRCPDVCRRAGTRCQRHRPHRRCQHRPIHDTHARRSDLRSSETRI